MKVSKAIEILKDAHKGGLGPVAPTTREAFKLGAEALKWIQFHRRISPDHVCKRLPGETPEDNTT